ncbi:MAG: YdcF family protein [Cyanobacteriota bacterium]
MKTLSPQQVDAIRQLVDYNDNFDAIVAFGYGPVQIGARPGSYQLNRYGRINAIATGMLYQSLNIGKIIPTGGKTGGSDKPSEAALMAHFIQSKFDIPASVFILEEEAMDTIYNLVHVANIIDQSPERYQKLLFVAMGFHLPRIEKICFLIKLNGSYIAAENIVKLRSERHQNLLKRSLHPDNPSYAIMLDSQERGMLGIKELPEYWIPPLGTLNNPQRLRAILAAKAIKSFLKNYHINLTTIPDEQLHTTIRLITRQFPD